MSTQVHRADAVTVDGAIEAPAEDDLTPVDPARPGPADRARLGSLPWVLVGCGTVGLVAAIVLLAEKIKLLEDPSYVPSCSLNPILSCGTIMKTEQASVLGLPNPVWGVLAFALVIATGAALLAGARLANWYWLGLQAGVLAGLLSIAWLAFESLYRIGALCPYCMVVWSVVLPLFWWVTAHNADAGRLRLPRSVADALVDYRTLLLVGSYLLIVVLAFLRFQDYWLSLL